MSPITGNNGTTETLSCNKSNANIHRKGLFKINFHIPVLVKDSIRINGGLDLVL